MLVLVLCFASTLLSMQVLAMVIACAFVMLHMRIILDGSLGGGALWVIVVVMLLALPLNIWRSPSVLPYVLVEGVAIALALVLAANREAYWRASRMVLLVSQGLILGYLAVRGLDDFPLEEMIPGASSNGVTSYLILLQCNYSLARFVSSQRVSLFTTIITVGICIVGWGRGSMVASLGLFALNAVFLFRQWRVLGRWWPIPTMVTFGLLIVLQWDAVFAYLEANTKLGAGLYDAGRSGILEAYLNKLDGWTLMWGADYSGTRVEEDYRGNPHNSFIRAHHLYGLLYLLSIFLPIVWALSRKMITALRVYGFVIISILLLRAFTEPILFPTLLDMFFFAMCLTLGRASHVSKVSHACR